MCWNWKVSIGSWILCTSIAVYCWRRGYKNDRYLMTWLIVFSSIQLLEFLMWTDIACAYGLNDIATRIAYFDIWLQPLSLLLGSPLSQTKFRFGISSKPFVLLGLFIVLPITLNGIFFTIIDHSQNWCSFPGCHEHLAWSFTRIPPLDHSKNFFVTALVSIGYPNEWIVLSFEIVFFITALLPLFLLDDILGIFYGILGLVTIIVTYAYYGSEEFTSMWCFEAASCSFLHMFLNKKKKPSGKHR